MADELDPLPDDLRAAFDAERRRSDVDAAMRDRLMGRVLGSIAVGAAIGTAAGTASAATAGAGGAAAGAGGAAATASAPAAGVAFAKMAPWLLGAFLLGGGVGAAVHAAVATKDAPPSPSAIATTPSAPPTETTPPSPTGSVTALAPSALPSGRAPAPSTATPIATSGRVSPSAEPSPPRDVDLAAERALVDRARTALTRGQPAAALEALDAHAKSFPRGRLAEEREALAVDALARAGRAGEASARADRFRATWPNSVFGGLVDGASPPKH